QAQERLPADSMELGRKYTIWFYTGMADSLIAHMPAENRLNVTPDQIMGQLAQVTEHAGNEVSVMEEKFITRNGRRQYWRTSKFDHMDEPFLLRWVINSKGEIDGVGMGPLSEAPAIDPPKNN
ncbi:MAG: hypothetical protein ABI679_15210, partial [Gemmatimonadota bacterium]